MSNTKKQCIFCGNLPDEKTKEHILPKWLLEFTGDTNRTVFLGMDLPHYKKTGKLKERKYSLSAFHFPACSSCNSNFSKLEHHAKLVMEKIFRADFLNNDELTILLDWFDKVRMGLWLAYTRLDGFSDEINPFIHISTRVRQKDRALFIYDYRDDIKDGLGFSGVNSPAFYQVPSCFSLRINNKLFINASADFLTSKNLGFNYGKLNDLEEKGLHQMFDIALGDGKIRYPIVGFPYASGAAEIYQVISSNHLAANLAPGIDKILFDDSYLSANCLPQFSDNSIKVSKIFYKELENNEIRILQEDEEIDITPTAPKSIKATEDIIINMISKIQVWLFKRRFLAHLIPESKKSNLLQSQAETFAAQKSFVRSK